jgi:ectoine hydroxylase-related dioxygenase (phytanoyl-CoA dioxygenase family)
MNLSAQEKGQLDEAGYLILDRAVNADFLEALARRVAELFAVEGDRAGAEFKQEAGCRRLANLADKDEIFHRALLWPPLLAGVRHVLGPEFKLSSLNARLVNPCSDVAQPLHADMGAVPDEHGYWVFNSVWMLDDFTLDNGPLRAVPGSHRSGRLPQQALADPAAPHPEEIVLTGRRGTVVLMNAHLWHGGLANHTAASRTALHVFFVRRDKPQQQYQKRLIRPEVQRQLSPELRWLLALDDPHNDIVSASQPACSGFMK